MDEKTWTKYESYMLNQGVTKLRLRKLKVMYVTLLRDIPKPITELTRKDIETYLDKLNRDVLKKKDGEDFSGSTKSDIKKFLKQFFKWYKGNGEFYPPEVAWIKVKIPKDELPNEKDTLNPEQIIKLSDSFVKPEFRLIILLLFDSGFRIQEMLSVRKKDLTFEAFNEQREKCFWVRCRASKTEERNIPIQLFTDEIKTYCNTQAFKNLDDNDLLFKDVSAESLRLHTKKRCLKLFNKRISIHNLRHSSATYYAKILDGNMNLLAERYGWTYDSKQLKTYIKRSGAYQKLGAKQVYSNQIGTVKEENEALKIQLQQQQEIINKILEKQKQYEEALKGIDLFNKHKDKISRR